MDINSILDQVNELTSERRKSEPKNKTLTSVDFTPNNNRLIGEAREGESRAYSVDSDIARKYNEYGLQWTPEDYYSGNLDLQLANIQTRGEKWRHSIAQTLISEMLLGTIKSAPDLYDIITGAAFRSDNDFSNPASKFIESLQEQFKENYPIYTDPSKQLGSGGLSDAGWWASNFPSIMSTLTLLVPSRAVVGVAKGLSKLARLGIATSTRAARAHNALMKATKLGRNTIRGQAVRRMAENGLAAVTMRTLENYQEARQTYNDIYKEASETLNKMTPEEYQDFLEQSKNNTTFWGTSLEEANQRGRLDLNDRDAVARQIAHNGANKTFVSDYQNIIFDVIQINALRNPLKYSKNMRATAAVNRAQRERILGVMKSAGINVEEGSKKSLLKGVGNFIKDRVGAGAIVISELSEGVEEAVNYIAQQEGMHYANVMFGKDEDNDFWDDRLWSYLHNADLYDAAFWGVLGGVGFQIGGSGINRITNRIQGSSKSKIEAKKGKKTKEKNNSDWLKKYMTSEDRFRTDEMGKTVIEINQLKDQLNTINNHHDPYNTERELTTEEEHEIARERVIKEYLTSLTFHSIDSGTWDLTKEFLRDSGVQEALQKMGVIDNDSRDVEDLIKYMEKVEADYNDELLRVSQITTEFTDMPFEYIQIIARDNAKAKQDVDRYTEEINKYKLSSESNETLFEHNLDETVDYRSVIGLQIAAKRIAQLNAMKKEINSSKERRDSVDGQQQLNEINRELNLLYTHILGTTPKRTIMLNGEVIEEDDVLRQLSRLMYTIGYASQYEFTPENGFTINSTSDEYLDFIQNISTGNLKSIIESKATELGNRSFEVTDEQIIRLFGDTVKDDTNGLYQKLKEDIKHVFDEKNGLIKRAKPLYDDYVNLSVLELGRVQAQARMNTTTEAVDRKISEIHNWMNKARANAIVQSKEVIKQLGKTYGYDTMMSAIFKNVPIENISEEDRGKLAEALEVLNLTAESNKIIAADLKNTLLTAFIESEIEQAADEAKPDPETGENSSGSQNSISKGQEQGSINSSAQTQQLNDGQEIGHNQENITQKPLEDTRTQAPQKLVISVDVDGKINATNVDDSDEDFGFKYQTSDNGFVEVKADETKDIPKEILAKKEIFDGFDPNNTNSFDIITNPILTKDKDGNWHVYKKGVIRYKGQTATSSTSSTGEVKQTKTRKATVSQEGELIFEEDKNEEAERDKLNNDVKERIKTLLSEAKDKLTEEQIAAQIAQIKQELANKYNIPDDQFNSALNSWHRILLNSYNERGLLKSSSEVLLSTVTETNGKFEFGKDYIKAVDKMIADYSKEFNLDQINGKYYVSLEDLLRRINYIYNDPDIASMMFDAMVAYMRSEDGRNKYVITDDNVDSVLDKVEISAEDRREQLIGTDDNHRVAIDKYFATGGEQFRKAYATLREGEVLKFEAGSGRIYLLKNGVRIGELPLPNIGRKSGALYNINMGWHEEVWSEPDGIHSNLSEFYEAVLNHNTELTKQLYDNIVSYNNDPLNDEERRQVVDNIYDLIKKVLNEVNYDISEIIDLSRGDTEQNVVDHFANVLRYFNKPVDPDMYEAWVQDSVQDWFNKLYNSYKAITDLGSNINSGNAEIRITNMTSGEVIRNFIGTQDRRDFYKNYYKMTQSNDGALAEGTEPIIGIINPTDVNEFITSETILPVADKQMEYRNKGNVYVVIKKNNRNSKGNYERENADFVIGTGVKMSDSKIIGDAKKVFNAIEKEINYLFDEFTKNPTKENFDKLNDFLHKVFYRTWNEGSALGITPNTGIVFGVLYKYFEKDGVLQLDSDSGRVSIQINTGKITTNDDLSQTTTYFGIKTGNLTDPTNKFRPLQNNEEGIKLIKDAFKLLFKNSQFNVALTHILGDSNNNLPYGLITRNPDTREVTISIPNSRTGKATTYTYKSFNELVLNGGFIRVNTHIEEGSNYRHKGLDRNQAANQILEVSIKYNSTSPVERNKQRTQTTISTPKFDIKSVFKDGIASIDDILANSGLSEEAINLLKSLDLLPKTIKFAADLNPKKIKGEDNVERWIGDNAQSVIGTGETLVGNRWIEMFNETGEFALNPKGASRAQAIRKLIHEQLHHKLHADKSKRAEYLNKIREIYSDFAKYIDDKQISNDAHIRIYLFAPIYEEVKNNETGEITKKLIKGYNEEEKRLEEFLVESITSKELSDYLNNIQVDDDGTQKSLFQKIKDFVKKILGLDVNKGSLLEKELSTIQDIFKDTEEIIDESTENVEEKAKPKRNRSREVKSIKNVNDTRRSSSVTETIPNDTKYYPSFLDFAYMSDNPAEVIRAAENGELNIICK